MRIRTFYSVLMIVALLLGLTACGGVTPLTPGSSLPGQETQAPPETTEAPGPVLPQPKGADSVKTLMELSLDYFHSGCDYSKIAEYHNPQAYLAVFFMEDFYRDEEMSLDQAMEKAALVYGDAETLRARDPKLAEMILEEMDVEDPDEALSDYMSEIRSAMRNGEIAEDDPNYAKYSQLLTDWDKGADYVFEHYPELLQDAKDRGVAFGLEGALEQLQRYARFEIFRSPEENERFQDLECEYRPENTYVNSDGVCSYDMGYVAHGSDAWSVYMLYYVKDGLYYLIGYSYSVGTIGG